MSDTINLNNTDPIGFVERLRSYPFDGPGGIEYEVEWEQDSLADVSDEMAEARERRAEDAGTGLNNDCAECGHEVGTIIVERDGYEGYDFRPFYVRADMSVVCEDH